MTSAGIYGCRIIARLFRDYFLAAIMISLLSLSRGMRVTGKSFIVRVLIDRWNFIFRIPWLTRAVTRGMWIRSLFNRHRDIDRGNGILSATMKRFRFLVFAEKTWRTGEKRREINDRNRVTRFGSRGCGRPICIWSVELDCSRSDTSNRFLSTSPPIIVTTIDIHGWYPLRYIASLF